MKNPLYQKIRVELTKEIERLRPAANTPFLTENEAIERFGTSRITVRRAFELLEREGYIYRVQGRGSFIAPHQAKPTKTVAFLATCILTNGIESVLLRSIEDCIDKHNYNTVICNNNNDMLRTERYVKRLIETKVDAIIFICPISGTEYEKSAKHIEFIQNNDIPCVLVDRYLPSIKEDTFVVTADNFNGAYRMAEHLISIGHTKIGFCKGAYTSAQEDRIRGFEKCLTDHGIAVEPEYMKSVLNDDEFNVVAAQYSMMKDRPSVVFVVCDEMAYRLVKAFSYFNLRVPADIAVVGFDDFSLQADKSVNLTTMRVPLWEEGKLAASIVVDLLQGKDLTPTHIEVPCELVIRESCGIKTFGRNPAAAAG